MGAPARSGKSIFFFSAVTQLHFIFSICSVSRTLSGSAPCVGTQGLLVCAFFVGGKSAVVLDLARLCSHHRLLIKENTLQLLQQRHSHTKIILRQDASIRLKKSPEVSPAPRSNRCSVPRGQQDSFFETLCCGSHADRHVR